LFVKPEEYLIGIEFVVPRPYMDLMDFNHIEVRICYRVYKLKNLLNDWTLKRMKKLLENNSFEDFKKEYIERNEMENKELDVKFGDLVKVMGKILNEQSKNFEHTIELVNDPTVNSLLDDIKKIKEEIDLKHNQIYGIENKIHSIISLNIGALEDFEG
jgi:ERCC4-related helicase